MTDPGRSTDRHRRAQAGFSLVESLVAVVVTSLWVLALIGGLLVVTASDASSSARRDIETALAGAGQVLKQGTYLRCGDPRAPAPVEYQAVLGEGDAPFAAPAGVTVAVTAVQHWDPTRAEFVDACPSPDGGAQRLTVSATDEDGQTLSAQVVKAVP